MSSEADDTHIDASEADEANDAGVGDGTAASAPELIPDDGDWQPEEDEDEPDDAEFEEISEPAIPDT